MKMIIRTMSITKAQKMTRDQLDACCDCLDDGEYVPDEFTCKKCGQTYCKPCFKVHQEDCE